MAVTARTARQERRHDPQPAASPSSNLDSSKQQNGGLANEDFRAFDVGPEFLLEPPTPAEAEFRHSSWASQRRAVWQSLIRTGSRGAQLQAFACCGSACWVQHSSSRGKFRLSSNACKSRWCVPCGHARAARLRASVKAALADWQRVRFVTFTIRHSQTPLTDQINRIQASFKELRRRPVWTDSVAGSAAFLEVKVSDRDGLWHPHLHCLCVGGWIDAKALSREWHKVTGDSTNVKVEEAKTANGVAFYVTKYVTKPLDGSVFASPDRLDEAIISLKGRRLVNAAGLLKGMSDKAAPDGVDDWHTIARLDDLIRDAAGGDTQAKMILEGLDRRDAARDDEHRRKKPPPPA